ncbi:TorD/DmsD family molecular chaperone [Halorussus sp. AFM4]|uniref:TorD/DmsD family molecular chaperone n=1 Tax=Halorussus sp. AFM4 TaxID=3421651 RepID=UPI003EC14C2A
MSVPESVVRTRLQLLDFLLHALADAPAEAFATELFADEATLPDAEINDPLDDGFERLREFYAANRDRPSEEVWRDLVTEYARLFESEDPAVATTESAHRPAEEVEESDVAERYEAAGWSPPADAPADALWVELAFVRHLVARQREDDAALDAERRFLDDHLLRWADDVAEALADATESTFYRAIAAVLLGVTTFEAAFVTERAAE